jgi:hypothetical protein
MPLRLSETRNVIHPGDKFGKLTAVQYLRTILNRKHYSQVWFFRCDCGAELEREIMNVTTSWRRGFSPCCSICNPSRTEMKKAIVVEGKVFGKLTALAKTGRFTNNRRPIWRFQCQCGRIVEKATGAVLRTIREGFSPNCGSPECDNKSRLLPGEGVKKRVIESYKKGAKDRGLSFDLFDEQTEVLLAGKCHYCGTNPMTTQKRKDLRGEFVYNGIDRIENSKGYIPGNVVSCCRYCNRAKSDMSYEEFMRWINRLVEYQIWKTG